MQELGRPDERTPREGAITGAGFKKILGIGIQRSLTQIFREMEEEAGIDSQMNYRTGCRIVPRTLDKAPK